MEEEVAWKVGDEVMREEVVKIALVESVAVTTTTGTEEVSWTVDDDRTSVEVRTSVITLVETGAGAVAVTTTIGTDEVVSWTIDDEDRTSVEVRTSVTTLVATGAGAVAVTTTTGTEEGDAVTKEEEVTVATLVGMTEDVTVVTTTLAAEGLWKEGDVLRDR